MGAYLTFLKQSHVCMAMLQLLPLQMIGHAMSILVKLLTPIDAMTKYTEGTAVILATITKYRTQWFQVKMDLYFYCFMSFLYRVYLAFIAQIQFSVHSFTIVGLVEESNCSLNLDKKSFYKLFKSKVRPIWVPSGFILEDFNNL